MKKLYPLFILVLFSYCTSYESAIRMNETPRIEFQGDTYDEIPHNKFRAAKDEPLTTFSIDVDGASYSNIRRMITDRILPPSEAVRVEEMINYFDYNFPYTDENIPFNVSTELGIAPWNKDHQLLQIGIRGKELTSDLQPPSNLVFLIDVSGSMGDDDKLPLLKKGFKLLVNELDQYDFVSIVTYSDKTNIVLEPTPGSDKKAILKAISRLKSGGGTAGGRGIQKAYELALENFDEYSNNRVILATDGDFNIGVSSDQELTELVESHRDSGIYLSVLGFGSGNLRDSKMEKMADHGNGNYFYIDNLPEAKKVFVTNINSTLHSVANDMKIQVEFNPANVLAYRLIGYENRVMENSGFNNDKKDAGELGAGQSITALYEIVPATSEMVAGLYEVDPLRYQYSDNKVTVHEEELLNVKIRYKNPGETISKFYSMPVMKDLVNPVPSHNFNFAASVAMFGMILSNSPYKGNSSFELINDYAKSSVGNDRYGYRGEFIRLVEHAELLAN